jgi:pathogenesis-related protein 1
MRACRWLVALLLAAGCEGGPFGEPDAASQSPPSADAQTWLDLHNTVRRSARPAPSPPLPELTWSADAASVAQAWADRCTYQHNAGRGERGENIAASAPPGHWTASDVVAAWASEAQDYDYATNTCAPGKECGHYTQLVWRNSLRVGCAHQVCGTNWPFAPSPPGRWDFFVCDYEPPGNWVGQKPY